MSWFWIMMFFTFAFSSNFSEAKHHKKSSAVVVGTVYCDTCFQQDIPKASHFIAGASIAVECKDTRSSNPTFRQEVQTDRHGQFKVHLPFPVSKHVKKIKGCSVKLITSNEPYCSIAAATATSSNLHLKSRKQGTHIFSAGFLTFRPLKKPTVCDQNPSTNNNNLKKLNTEKLSPFLNPNDPAFPSPVKDLPPSETPTLGRLLPPLPRLLPLPEIPFLPPKHKKETELSDDNNNNNNNNAVNQPGLFPFPPNPFNPPSIFPPNPFQPPSLIPPVFPSPTPSIFPPLFPLPSPSPLFQLPPIPGLTPSPPLPPPPVFPIPLPPFPFQPTPGFPGVPPAEVSSPSETSSP